MLGFSLGPVIGPKIPLSAVLEPYWPVFVVGFIFSMLVTPIAIKAAFRFKIMDIPNVTVKTHKNPTAYLGGVAVLVGFLAAMTVGTFLIEKRFMDVSQIKIILAICGGAILSCLVGLIDDVKDIRPWQKLLGQAVCSLFLVWASVKPALQPIFAVVGITVSPVLHDILAYLTVLVFVLGASNSLNLLDGLDGLCTGVTAIMTVGLFVLATHLATWASHPTLDPIRLITTMSLVGAALGFLVYNRHPAKIFLGDAGSILLGFIIAAVMMLLATRNPRWWLASMMIFGLPILDTGTALIRRALNKRPLFVSDRGHIYDQMIDRGIPMQRTVAINYLLSALYALIGILGAIFIPARYAAIVYLLIGIISFTIVGRKGYFRMSGLRGAGGKKVD
ncbi:MAG: MraY family glycosyltransferase [Phycisphaerae bacterium]